MKLSLEAIATLIEANTEAKAEVADTWIDYGAGIHQNQIIIDDGSGLTYQLLTPRELDEVELETYTLEQVQDHIDVINGVKKPYWMR